MNVDRDRERTDRRRALSPVLEAEDYRPASSTVRVEFGACSDTRVHGAPNEDQYHVVRLSRGQETVVSSLADSDVNPRFFEQAYAMVVADGVRGTPGGSMASRVAIATLMHLVVHYGHWNVRVDSRTAFEIIERIDWCYGQVADAVRDRARTNRHLYGMATKLTAAYSAGDELFVVYSGYSMAFVLREGRLMRLVAEEASATNSPEENLARLTPEGEPELSDAVADTLGGPQKAAITIERYRIHDGDLLMLCSSSMLSALKLDHIADILADRRELPDMARMLVNAALQVRAADSVTVVLAHYRIPRMPA